jgi:hypothetical protein
MSQKKKIAGMLAVVLAMSAVAPPALHSAAAPPVSPAGTWLVPPSHAAPLDILTSIGVLALRDKHAKDGYPFTEVELNGKRLVLDGDGRFDLGHLEIERVLDFGGSIDLVYAAGCGGKASFCHSARSIAQVDRTGRIRSKVSAQQDWERAPDAQASDNGKDWTEQGSAWAMVLGRKEGRVREVQLSSEGMRLVTRPPHPGELAELKKLSQQP